MNILHNKKFKHGSVSVALVIVIIAAVILVNAIFTALARKNLWYIDMTPDSMYTLSDGAKSLLSEAKFGEKKTVEVIFCAEKDVLEASTEQRLALHTVLDIAALYNNVQVRYVDVYTNPSAVAKYKLHTTQKINSQSIIVASGEECRVHSLVSLFALDGTTQEVIGYNGEQKLISSMLAVTQDEMPIACMTVNHGEAENEENFNALSSLLWETGYEVEPLDLSKNDIPDAARLVVIFDPQDPFLGGEDEDSLEDVNELSKLDDFLDAGNSVMVFVDNETPYSEDFEQFLAEWGIKIARYDDVLENKDPSDDINLLIRDLDHSLTTSGYTNVASYVPSTGGLGYSLIKGLASRQNPKTVVFPNATAFTLPDGYLDRNDEQNGTWSYVYSDNGIPRICYDVFLSSDTAEAIVDGQKLRNSELEKIGLHNPAQVPFSYMRITQETHATPGEESTSSYLMACASTEFVRPAALSSTYGNHEMLTYACSVMGRDVVSVSLSCKYFASTEIANITASEANQYTIVLTVVPAAIIFVAGVVIMIRRKYA